MTDRVTDKCRKCGGEMKPGIAMQSTYTGIPDFPGGAVVTISPGGPGRIVAARKCVKCGWSVTSGGASNHYFEFGW